MGRPRKISNEVTATFTDGPELVIDMSPEPLPARPLLPALLVKAKADGDQALIDRILAACSE
jgi:hypothetical protein